MTHVLDRSVQFLRAVPLDTGVTEEEEFSNHGGLRFASKKDVSDSERLRAGELSSLLTCRFVVRYTPFTADITPRDRVACEGKVYEITGIKEVGDRRSFLEITAAVRNDLVAP
jgi:head-tail adaptor